MKVSIALAFLFTTVNAQALPFTGRVYSDQYVYTRSGRAGEIAQSSLSSWIEYDWKRDETNPSTVALHLVGQADVFYRDLNHPNEASARLRLREGFASFMTDEVTWRAGQQIIPWGKSDGINPTDYFTAKDYTVFNPDDEVKRIGAPGISVNYTPNDGTSPINIQSVFQAYYPRYRLLIPTQAIPVGLTFDRYGSSPEAFHADAMEFGFKIAYLRSNYDFSFSYFQGYTHFSEYEFDAFQNRIAPINPKQKAVGGDASFTLGSYVVRIETAMLMPENGTDTDPAFGLVEPWHWDTVIGAEHTVADDFHLQVQATVRHHVYYQTPSNYISGSANVTALQQAIGRANALILNFQQQTNVGATFRVGYANESSRWTADLFLVGYFIAGQDFLWRPQIGYQPVENLRLTTGLDWYGGDDSRPLGAIKDRSVAFFEAKYSF